MKNYPYDKTPAPTRPVPSRYIASITPAASGRQVGGDHYKDLPIQPSHFIRKNKLGWHEGNAIKYICRHNLKGDGRRDIEKAIHYLELILEEDYPTAGVK